MSLKQVSIFLENKEGRLYEVAKLLGDSHINMRALCVAETADYGVARMIVDKPEAAVKVLKDNGFTVKETDVLAVQISDEPGGLAGVLKILRDGDINVEYLYCFTTPREGNAVDVMRVEDLESAIKALEKNNVNILNQEDISSL